MMFIFKPRIWFLIVTLVCAGMLSYAIYVQHVDFVDPCPLCVFQRMAFMWIGAVSMVAVVHNPQAVGKWVYGGLVSFGGIAGASIAGRHLWLQSLSPDRVPDCGMGLNYMLDTMPFGQVLSEVFYGSGECAEVHWTFLGLSMPGWTFFWYMALTLGTITVLMILKKVRA